jgi:hypothetical protein
VIDPSYFGAGQEHFDRGTLADACLDSDTSARLLRETDHLGEAEAGVLPRLPSSEKRLENVGKDIVRNT